MMGDCGPFGLVTFNSVVISDWLHLSFVLTVSVELSFDWLVLEPKYSCLN